MNHLLILKPAECRTAEENWRFVPGYSDYMVSDRGRVMSLKHGSSRLLKPWTETCGYACVWLYDKGIQTSHRIHRLVGKAFLPNPQGLPQMNHRNGCKTDNRVENLEWCDAYTNVQHAILHGLFNNKPCPCRITDPQGGERRYPSVAAMARAEGFEYNKLKRQLREEEDVRNPYPNVQRL